MSAARASFIGLLAATAAITATTPAWAAESALTLQTGVLPVTTRFEPARLETGTGFVVAATIRSRERFFVFTCAHLTGGESTKLGGRPIEEAALARRTDSFHDIDVIETKAVEGLQPFARLSADGKSLAVNPAALNAWAKNGQRTLNVESKAKGSAFALVPSWSLAGAAEAAFPGRAKQWSTNDLFTSSDKSRGLVYHVVGSTVGAPASIAPGMSCAPLVDRAGGKPVVRGMGTEFKNKMMGSSFASDRQLLRGLKALLAGETGLVGPSRWRSQNGLLYRTFGEDRSEIVPLDRPAGNGISTSPGAGATSPRCGSVSAQEIWKNIGSAPALRWDGRNVIGFRVTITGQDESILITPNHSGLEFLLRSARFAKATGVPAGTPLLPEFDAKYVKAARYTVASPALGKIPGPRLERSGDGLTVTLFGDRGRERIVFRLNEYGALANSLETKTFYPVVDVKGSKGGIYTVDLRGLFFADVSDWTIAVADAAESFDALEDALVDKPANSPELYVGLMRAQQILQRIAPSISYRRQCARDEYHFSFSRRYELAAKPPKNKRKPAANRR